MYVAMLIEIAADGTARLARTLTPASRTAAKALFVLRHRGAVPPGTVLYKISWATFVAYNGTGYGSLYAEAVWSRAAAAIRASRSLGGGRAAAPAAW